MELVCKLRREDFVFLGLVDFRRFDTEFLNLRVEGFWEDVFGRFRVSKLVRIFL